MFRKKQKTKSYDRENLRPIIRVSICTGEQVAGFKNKKTGQFTEVMLIQKEKDLEEFKKRYGVEEIKKEY
jgi:hypothetical protein